MSNLSIEDYEDLIMRIELIGNTIHEDTDEEDNPEKKRITRSIVEKAMDCKEDINSLLEHICNERSLITRTSAIEICQDRCIDISRLIESLDDRRAYQQSSLVEFIDSQTDYEIDEIERFVYMHIQSVIGRL